ncbi:MAG: hypothetical protein OEM18_02650 [Nitrosopumilus sp.]|nr:hypothetical protein [Nitrosopumilus sp.]
MQLIQLSPIQCLNKMKGDNHIIMFDENPVYSKKNSILFLKKSKMILIAMPYIQYNKLT